MSLYIALSKIGMKLSLEYGSMLEELVFSEVKLHSICIHENIASPKKQNYSIIIQSRLFTKRN